MMMVIISPHHHDNHQGTVFIPTNEAFKLLPGDKMDKAISADLDRWLLYFVYSFVVPHPHPHHCHQDSWSPLPGPKRAVWWHQDTSSTGWRWGQFGMSCDQKISSCIFLQCFHNQQCSDVQPACSLPTCNFFSYLDVARGGQLTGSHHHQHHHQHQHHHHRSGFTLGKLVVIVINFVVIDIILLITIATITTVTMSM